MKVTVCFRDIKIVVPCGDGSGLVKGLLEESLARYKKAQTKNVDNSWLNLKTVKLLLCDGGILDLDDRINDVIDDKEQIRAIVNGNSDRLLHEHSDNNGDGTSGSSLGTCSPDIFHDNLGERDGEEMCDVLGNGCRDVIITKQDFLSESGLSVRRESEPALCTSSDLDSSGIELSTEYPIYSAINRKSGDSCKETLGSDFKAGHWTNNAGGQTSATMHQSVNAIAEMSEDLETEQQNKEMIFVLPKSKEALGIHVIPAFDHQGRNIGLLIEKIEQGGRADRDHRLKTGDKIIEINFQNLFQVDFSRAQEIFRSAFLAPELQIRALRPVRPASQNSTEPKDQNTTVSTSACVELKHADVTKRTPPAVPVRSPTARLSLKGPAGLTMYTKSIDLVKGSNGLGFSVTTHGNRDGDCSPIYIKHIFSVGAAVEEGHLKPGDVLLEINGIPLADKTKAEAVRLLRNLPTGSTVHLRISRALTMHETAVQQRTDHGRRPVTQRPFSLTGFRQTSTSSCSDRTEEEDVGDEKEQDVGAKENTTSYRKFGSASNIAKSGLNDDFDEENDPNVASKLRADKRESALTLQKSRKSISLDDLRRQNSTQSGAEIAFDDDGIDSPVAFRKMRDFNQSFRTAVIDKAARSRPATGSGSESAEYIAAIEKADKLRQNGDKKNKGKKDHERGSGRKFGWLFRFGKGRKSDSECIRTTPSEVPGSRIVTNKIEMPPVQKHKLSNSSSVAVTEPKNVNLHQPTSQLSGQSHHPGEPVKEMESSYVRLHKEDYMITAVPSQQKPSRQDHSQFYPKHAAANLACGEPWSCEHPQKVRDNLRGQLGRHEKTNNQYNVQQQQQKKFYHPHSSNVHRKSALLGPGTIYRNWVDSETADPSQRFNRQDLLPSGGDHQPSLKYCHDDNTGLNSYKDKEHYPQFIKPDVSDLFPQRRLEPLARSGHYYRQDNYGGQSRHYRQQRNPYTKDPTWDQAPMDLSRYTAVRAQDRADVGYGYRSQEYDLQTRQQINSNLKITHEPPSNYPPYKSVSPNVTKDMDFSRERHARQMDGRTGAVVVEHRRHSYRHPTQPWQNNPAIVAERW